VNRASGQKRQEHGDDEVHPRAHESSLSRMCRMVIPDTSPFAMDVAAMDEVSSSMNTASTS
jgi:hypothetical protein